LALSAKVRSVLACLIILAGGVVFDDHIDSGGITPAQKLKMAA